MLKKILIFLSLSSFAFAQHSATLTWTASTDTGGTVNVYRALTACTGTPSFVKLQSGVAAAGPYVDSTLGAGLFCYYVTAVVGGVESLPSNQVGLTIVPAAPTSLGGKQTA